REARGWRSWSFRRVAAGCGWTLRSSPRRWPRGFSSTRCDWPRAGCRASSKAAWASWARGSRTATNAARCRRRSGLTALAVGGVDTQDAHFRREVAQFLQGEGNVRVLGMALDVGVEFG